MDRLSPGAALVADLDTDVIGVQLDADGQAAAWPTGPAVQAGVGNQLRQAQDRVVGARPSRMAARNRRASPACSGTAGKARDHAISGAVVSGMASRDHDAAALIGRLLVVILIRWALGSLAKTGCRQGVSERHPGWRGRPESGAAVPLTRELDPTAGPLDFFGAEVRRWRTAAGLSQEQLGQKVGYSGAQVGKVETGERAPSQDFAEGCDRALPQAAGLFLRLYQLARRWDGGYPSWFTESVEPTAGHLMRTWQPLLVPGLLQTPDYARALFLAWRAADSDDELDRLVGARIERQSMFQRPARRRCGPSSMRACCAAASAAKRSCTTSWSICWRCLSGPRSWSR